MNSALTSIVVNSPPDQYGALESGGKLLSKLWSNLHFAAIAGTQHNISTHAFCLANPQAEGVDLEAAKRIEDAYNAPVDEVSNSPDQRVVFQYLVCPQAPSCAH